MARIKAPNSEYNGVVGDVVFKDGVAETDNQAVIQYCQGAGYEVDGTTDNPPAVPEAADPRYVDEVKVGTPLRDAAVDPRPEDFLPPVNAGKPGPEGNPHGPNVVAPGIHAVAGPGPIVPGPVGRFEEDEDGTQVVIADTEEQQRRETTAAEQVFLQRRDVPEVTAELADEVQPVDDAKAEPPAGNASQADWADWVIAAHPDLNEDEVRAMKRDELRDQYGPKAE